MDLAEVRRLQEMSYWEDRLSREGYLRLAGVDEAGRGPLAGPVVAAAVVLPAGLRIEGLRDSKQLTAVQRERLYRTIRSCALDFGIGIIDNRIIDQVNILQATYLAARQALTALRAAPDYLLLDAIKLPQTPIRQWSIVRGDARCHSIAAASVLAKVTRDRLMAIYHLEYPDYDFSSHKGYGTRDHLMRLRRFGPCEIHRMTYKGVKELA